MRPAGQSALVAQPLAPEAGCTHCPCWHTSPLRHSALEAHPPGSALPAGWGAGWYEGWGAGWYEGWGAGWYEG